MGTGGALGPLPAGWHPSTPASAKGVRGRDAAIVAAGAAALGEGGRALPAVAAAAEPVPPRSMPRGCGVRRSPLSRFPPPEAGARGRLGKLGKAGGRRAGTTSARLADLTECEPRPGEGAVCVIAPQGLFAGFFTHPKPPGGPRGPDASQSTRKSPSDPGKDLLSPSQAKTQAVWELK